VSHQCECGRFYIGEHAEHRDQNCPLEPHECMYCDCMMRRCDKTAHERDCPPFLLAENRRLQRQISELIDAADAAALDDDAERVHRRIGRFVRSPSRARSRSRSPSPTTLVIDESDAE